MNTLVIDRMHHHLRSARPIAPERVAAWSDAFAALDADALTGGLAGADEWLLVRKLSIKASWKHDAGLGDVALTWRQALQEALAQALAGRGGDEVVRYETLRDAQADLLYRSAQGDRGRQWAWHRMGLLARADAGAAQALAQGAERLLAAPETIWPVIARLVRSEAATASLGAVLRALPANAWMALLAAAPRSRGHALALSMRAGPPPAADELEDADAAMRSAPDACALVDWARARPDLLERRRDALVVLAAGLARSAAGLTDAQAHASVAVARQALASAAHPVLRTTPAPAASTPHGGDESAASRIAERLAGLPPLPALESGVDWRPTDWGGALFWLARVGPDALLDEADDDAAPLSLRLLAIAQALGVPADDAARQAFCGGEPTDDARVPPLLVARAQVLAAGWSAWLADAAPDLPEPRLETVCRRRGRLRIEPGWIELHLALESVDVRVRRLGLDLDPGWLAWLGCVLRIRYEG
jgi:hypothetical protein